ncbi:unnamed protein product [Withania somnifera]
MVQIAFKPLTLKGLPETFLAALRDAINLNFRQSLMGSIESTVAYGPVYFNTQPNLRLSLSDVNILYALTLNVKTHGYNYTPGSKLICLSYRSYYIFLSTLNPKCKLTDSSNQTIVFEINFSKSKVTTSRNIRWEEINFPSTWILDSIISQSQTVDTFTNHEYSHISQTPEVEPVYGPTRNKVSSLHTISYIDRRVNKLKIDKDNIVRDDQSEDKDIPSTSEMDFNPNDF